MDVVQGFLRRVLGTDQLDEMGSTMAKASEQIDAVNAKLEDLLADVRANTDILSTKAGQLDDEGQAALDRLTATVDAADSEVGDADGSDTVPPTNSPPFSSDLNG